MADSVARQISTPVEFDERLQRCLLDSLGCGLLALNYSACTKLLGPVVPGATLPGGARLPGTDYELDPDLRSIANAVQVFFKDGSSTDRIEVEYPLGHRRRRDEAVCLLREKFRTNASTRFAVDRVDQLIDQFFDTDQIDSLTVDSFMDHFV